jgi:hypothetical protein
LLLGVAALSTGGEVQAGEPRIADTRRDPTAFRMHRLPPPTIAHHPPLQCRHNAPDAQRPTLLEVLTTEGASLMGSGQEVLSDPALVGGEAIPCPEVCRGGVTRGRTWTRLARARALPPVEALTTMEAGQTLALLVAGHQRPLGAA